MGWGEWCPRLPGNVPPAAVPRAVSSDPLPRLARIRPRLSRNLSPRNAAPRRFEFRVAKHVGNRFSGTEAISHYPPVSPERSYRQGGDALCSLNCALSRCLQEAGVVTTRTDDHLVPYPNRPGWEVRIDTDGCVTGFHLVPLEQVRVLRKYECSKGGLRESTPGFNIEPLFQPKADQDRRQFSRELSNFMSAVRKGSAGSVNDRKARLEEFLTRSEPGWGSRAKAVEQCLSIAAQTLLGKLKGGTDPDLASLGELLRRSSLLNAAGLHRQLSQVAQSQFADGSDNPDALVQLLFTKPSSAILELNDVDQFQYPANHQRVWQTLNQRLITAIPPAPESAEGDGNSHEDTFGQPMSPNTTKKMPERTLPRLGKVKLRSMAKSASCQSRYGLIEAEACPLGLELQAEFAAALEWATQPERQDITWADVSDSCGYDLPALLIAFPTRLPADPPHLSGFLARGGVAGERQERRFETFAQTVVERLQGLVSSDPRTTISVFVLAKADPRGPNSYIAASSPFAGSLKRPRSGNSKLGTSPQFSSGNFTRTVLLAGRHHLSRFRPRWFDV